MVYCTEMIVARYCNGGGILGTLFVLLTLTGLTIGCRSTQKAAYTVVRDDSELQQRAAAHAHFAAGVVQQLSGNAAAAADEFLQAAKASPKDADLLLDVSTRLLEARQFPQALEVLKLAAALPEVDALVFVRLGFVYSQLGQDKKALEANEIAVRRMPRFMPARQNLYLGFLQANRPAAALQVLDEAAALSDLDAETLISLAELYSDYSRRVPEQRDASRAKAVRLLERAQANVAGPLTLKLADGFFLLGKTDEAAALYLRFLERERSSQPMQEIVRAKLADIYLRVDERARAAEQLRALIQDNPANAGAHYFLGAIAAEEKRWPEAIAYFHRVLLLQPGFDQARLELATAQLATGDVDEAVQNLEEFRRQKGPSFVAEYLLGLAHHEKKDYAQAIKHLAAAERIAALEETNRLTTMFYFQLGATHERAGEREKAAEYFEKSIALDPQNAEALNYLGYMWAERGENIGRARELIEQALKLEPENEAFLDSMGWVLFQQGEYEGALKYLLEAVAKAEQPDATIYDHLGDAYQALKNMNKAREAWRQSLTVEANPKVQEKLDAAAQP